MNSLILLHLKSESIHVTSIMCLCEHKTICLNILQLPTSLSQLEKMGRSG